MRYNGFLTADLNGGAAPGYSTGQAQAVVEKIAAETFPKGIAFEWTDLTYQEIIAGNSSLVVFPVALLLVFLVLAAQYESLTLPLSIIMIVPMGLMAAMSGVWLTKGDNNVFTQIGLIVLVGLSAKNAILIVEFASELRTDGRTIREAAIEAARERFRPILMTSFAFILGVAPLLIASGAGAQSRHSIGTGVFFGMLTATTVGIFFIPLFFYLIARLGERGLFRRQAITPVPAGAGATPRSEGER